MTEISKYMRGVPRNVGDCVDASLCPYDGFFLQLTCILCTCELCGINQLKEKIEQLNVSRMADKSNRFMVKVWVTKTKEVSEGVKQSYLHWNHERLNYEGLLKLYCKQMKDMAEHTFHGNMELLPVQKGQAKSC